MSDFPPTGRSRLKRLPKRGSYDQSVIYPILDASLICSIAFVQEKQPEAIPTLFARDRDRIIIHGASTSRLIRHLQKDNDICRSVVIIGGIVLARSILEHSMKQQSALRMPVIFPSATPFFVIGCYSRFGRSRDLGHLLMSSRLNKFIGRQTAKA